MRQFQLLSLFILLLVSAGCSPTVHIPNAEFLGERTVNFGADRDEIRIGARSGSFRAVKVIVRRNDVNIRNLRIYFANGSTQNVELRRTIRAGGETRAIDLDGSNRRITRVVFWYDTRGHRGNRAVVQLYGLH